MATMTGRSRLAADGLSEAIAGQDGGWRSEVALQTYGHFADRDPSASIEARVRGAFVHCRAFSFVGYEREQRGFIAEAIDAFARATPRSVRTDSRERQGDPGGKRGDGPTEVGPSPGC